MNKQYGEGHWAYEHGTDAEYIAEALGEYASEHGRDSYSQWILSPFDSWMVNPHYAGPPQPHPEEPENEETDRMHEVYLAWRAAQPLTHQERQERDDKALDDYCIKAGFYRNEDNGPEG